MTAFLISFIIWAILHSITAAARPKHSIRQIMGEPAYMGLYRLLYNIFSIVTILPVLYLLATQVAAAPIWTISAPFNILFYGIQLLGLLSLGIALWQTDIWDFAGLRQAVYYLSGDIKSASPPQLVTNGMYRLVRHPLYFFSLLILWFRSPNGLAQPHLHHCQHPLLLAWLHLRGNANC